MIMAVIHIFKTSFVLSHLNKDSQLKIPCLYSTNFRRFPAFDQLWGEEI